MADKGFDAGVMLKNLTKSITDYGAIMGERTKFQSGLLANQLKLNQNWLWKLKEQQASPEAQMQRQMGQMFQQQQTGAGVATPGPDVFAGRVQPRVRMGAKGYKMHYPTQKEFIYSQIQAKKRRNMPLSEKEIKFEEGYLGIAEKEKKKDYLLKIPPKKFEAKKKGFWSQFGDEMVRVITGGFAGVTEADRTTTITEAKRKYAAGEELSSEEATLLTMNNIKTKQDIEELLENREQYESQGVDVRLILDFFTAEEEE